MPSEEELQEKDRTMRQEINNYLHEMESKFVKNKADPRDTQTYIDRVFNSKAEEVINDLRK